jgi:hypothetical protein
MRGNAHVRFGSAGRGNGCFERTTPRPGPILTSRLVGRLTSQNARVDGGRRSVMPFYVPSPRSSALEVDRARPDVSATARRLVADGTPPKWRGRRRP